jgi:hypothetical protein
MAASSAAEQYALALATLIVIVAGIGAVVYALVR